MNVDKETESVASGENTARLKEAIIKLKKEKDAVILAHYYQRAEIQEVADYIGDSLALAQIAEKLTCPVIVMCGVHFMAETTKILCPDKTVLVPAPEAGCSLADSCDADDFEKFIREHPGHTVISYVNTTARVKALTDIVVTSGNARKIVESLPAGEKIIFGPDRNLGDYICSCTGREMLLWDGACHVHERFSADRIKLLKAARPQAEVLVHPECPESVRELADRCGSTAVLLKHAVESPCDEFIVVTECGILHEMKLKCPGKTFIPAPPSDSCSQCNECSYMKLNTLERLYKCLVDEAPRIEVDPGLMEAARKPIERMLELS